MQANIKQTFAVKMSISHKKKEQAQAIAIELLSENSDSSKANHIGLNHKGIQQEHDIHFFPLPRVRSAMLHAKYGTSSYVSAAPAFLRQKI